MSLRTIATLSVAALMLAVVPVAEAQTQKKKRGHFQITTMRVSDRTVTAGERVRVAGRVRNRAGRRAASARLRYSLRRTRTARGGVRLATTRVRRTNGGRSRRYSKRVRVPAGTRARTYRLTACVRRARTRRADACKRRRMVVIRVVPAPSTVTPADNRSPSQKLRDAITGQGMLSHLRAFQEIADSNGGNRASGFQGYGGSVQYVLGVFRAAGYSPTTQLFNFVTFQELRTPVLRDGFADGADLYATNRVPDDDVLGQRGRGRRTITPVDPNLSPTRRSAFRRRAARPPTSPASRRVTSR